MDIGERSFNASIQTRQRSVAMSCTCNLRLSASCYARCPGDLPERVQMTATLIVFVLYVVQTVKTRITEVFLVSG